MRAIRYGGPAVTLQRWASLDCFNPLCVQLDMVPTMNEWRKVMEKFQSAVRAIRYGADAHEFVNKKIVPKFQSAVRAIRYGDAKGNPVNVWGAGFNPLCVQLDMVTDLQRARRSGMGNVSIRCACN